MHNKRGWGGEAEDGRFWPSCRARYHSQSNVPANCGAVWGPGGAGIQGRRQLEQTDL